LAFLAVWREMNTVGIPWRILPSETSKGNKLVPLGVKPNRHFTAETVQIPIL
jgi:hypothetical protein